MDYLFVGDQQLRLVLIAGQILFLVVANRWKLLFRLKSSQILVAIIGIHVISRLAAFSLLYIVIGIHAPGDVRAFYKPWAEAAAAGALPYSDIKTPFSPLFPYLLAALQRQIGRAHV